MALRHSEEPQRRLSPEEARAFLQVHAEREAAGTAADTPTAEDLAETLGLSPEETRSILQEARARIVVPEEKAATNHGQTRGFAAALLVLALGLAASLALLNVRTVRPAPAPAVMPAQRIELPPPAPTPPKSESPLPLGVRPPDGFRIMVESPSSRFDIGGATPNDGVDYGRLAPAESDAVRERLVASIVDLVWAKVPETDWANLRQLTLSVQLQGGRWTKLVVPVAPSTPFRSSLRSQEELRTSLTQVVEAAWPQIVQRAI